MKKVKMKTRIHHKEVADKIETVSMGISITSGVVAAGAALAAPTGFSAIGVALGITSVPLIVTVAPVIGAAATVTGVISGGAYFYSKWKSKKAKEDLGNKQSGFDYGTLAEKDES
jgi:O6-methylguanine-DNA--protein-cysteine methyltransferase